MTHDRRRSPVPSLAMASDPVALRMRAISSSRGWGWPVLSCAVAVVGVIVLALVHQQIDLSTYLLGGAHASSNDALHGDPAQGPSGLHLPAVLGPPVRALRPPSRSAPARWRSRWLNLAAVVALILVSLRAVCRTLDRRTMLWWALALLLPVVLLDPVRQTFLLGQVNIILALMVVADMTLDLPIPRGILVGLAAAIKVTPTILIPYLFLTRQGRAGRPGHRSPSVPPRCWPRRSTPRPRGPTGPTTSATRSGPACSRGSATRGCSVRWSACWATP